jgi:hypothetical protein
MFIARLQVFHKNAHSREYARDLGVCSSLEKNACGVWNELTYVIGKVNIYTCKSLGVSLFTYKVDKMEGSPH